jgi:ATP-binding cassette subfamily C protein CydCD
VKASYQPAIMTLLVAIVAVRAFGIARPVLRYVERLQSHDVGLRMLAQRRVEVYDAVVPLTPGALGRRRGDVLAAVVDDVDSVLDRELRVRMPVRGFVIVAVLVTGVAALVEPLAVPVVVPVCLAGVLGYALARIGAARAERDAVGARARLSETVVETTQTAGELAMWQAEDRALAAVGEIGAELGRRSVAAATWLATGRALVVLASGLGVAAAAIVLTPVVADGSLSGPMLALLVLLPLALGEVAAGMADAGALAARTRAAEDRLAALAARTPAVEEPGVPVSLDGDSVRLDRVTAAWGDREVLQDLDLVIEPGDRIAVVGPTGCGKSTLASLLMRFVDPVRGAVRLGDRALPELALDDVRRTVGLVDDDPHVFATTLVENVRLARPGATDAEVDVALRQARLGPWLDALPDGLDSWLGDGHAQVSGGERARIAIARSLLADQPVLVLDEPAAHLDGATADELAAEVLGGERGRTVVWITHAAAGLDRVDRVVELAQPSGTRQTNVVPRG